MSPPAANQANQNHQLATSQNQSQTTLNASEVSSSDGIAKFR